MGVSDQLVVLIVIVAAGASVMLGYATTRYFQSNGSIDTSQLPGEGPTQAQYMREVRLRNQEKLAHDYGHGRHALAAMRDNLRDASHSSVSIV